MLNTWLFGRREISFLERDEQKVSEKAGLRKKILFVFNYGRIKRLEENGPDDFFWGARRLSRESFDVAFLEPDPGTAGVKHSSGVVFPVPFFFRKLFSEMIPSGLLKRSIQAFFAREALKNKEFIVAIGATWFLAFRFLQRFGFLPGKVVGVLMGPYEFPRSLKSSLGAFLQRILLRGGKNYELFLSEADRLDFQRWFGKRSGKSFVIPFGIDETFWFPLVSNEEPKSFILAMGNPERDYGCLLQAWQSIEESLKIVSNQPISTSHERVEVIQGNWCDSPLSDRSIRELFQHSKFVIVPLRNGASPSGTSTILQAMACGKALIVSQSRGLPKGLIHLENCFLVPPGNPVALREGIEFLLRNPQECFRIGTNARRSIERSFSSSHLAKNLENILGQASFAESH